MKDSRPQKIVAFKRAWHPLDDATPTFISDSGSSILGLSYDISFVSEFLLEGG